MGQVHEHTQSKMEKQNITNGLPKPRYDPFSFSIIHCITTALIFKGIQEIFSFHRIPNYMQNVFGIRSLICK